MDHVDIVVFGVLIGGHPFCLTGQRFLHKSGLCRILWVDLHHFFCCLPDVLAFCSHGDSDVFPSDRFVLKVEYKSKFVQ